MIRQFFILLFAACLFQSCCKCSLSDHGASFRFLNSFGQDLLFGPSKIYESKNIRFYSMVGTDTVKHSVSAYLPSGINQDSLLSVGFEERGGPIVYVVLNSTDTDTLQLRYESTGGGCCPEGSNLYTSKYNMASVPATRGVTVITK